MSKIVMKISAREILKGLDDTADGVFLVDGNLRIQMWNKAAEEILGYGKGDVEGQLCYQILQGTDEAGKLICNQQCKVLSLAKETKPIASYDTQVHTNLRGHCWLNMSIIALRFGQSVQNILIMHIFRDISEKKDNEIIFNQIMQAARRYHENPVRIEKDNISPNLVEKLTRRQLEVLSLLAQGLSTREIADSLSISQYTARNHIQQIFQKFHVHSRLEAVAFAIKNGLLDHKNGADVLQK